MLVEVVKWNCRTKTTILHRGELIGIQKLAVLGALHRGNREPHSTQQGVWYVGNKIQDGIFFGMFSKSYDIYNENKVKNKVFFAAFSPFCCVPKTCR